MTQEEFDTHLKNFLSPNTEGKDPETAFMLNTLIDAAAFQKVKELLPPSAKTSKNTKQEQTDKVQNNGIKFSEEEIKLMPLKYRKVFAQDDRLVYYRQKPNGVYEARYHREGINIEVSSKDLNTLKQKFIEALQNLASTGNVKAKTAKTVKFNEFALSWLKLKEKTTKPATYGEYARLFHHDIEPYFEGKTLGEIDRDFLQNYLFSYVENEKFRTAEKIHLILRCIFDLAASDYKLQSPMDKVVLPKYETKKGKAFTYDEERQLVEYCKKNNNYSAASALLLLLYTGMRRSELSSITVLDDNWMQCETSKERMGSGVVTRRIPITPVMRRVLPYIDIEQAKATNLNTINTTIKRIFPNHHTHELRNTYITRLKECKVDPELVMLWDGHSFDKDVKTSAVDRGYTDFSEQYMLNEAKKVDYDI
ncbi:MAG: hypothetical protein LUD27_02380 [Clostridia bacterium]|nr:hypothetical protein [Clostridia bacterium]